MRIFGLQRLALFREAEKNRNIDKRVKSIRDKKRDGNDLRFMGESFPIFDERGLLHIGKLTFAIEVAGSDSLDLMFNNFRRIFVKIRSMSENKETGILRVSNSFSRGGHYLLGAMEKDLRHRFMKSNRLAIVKGLIVALSDRALELKFSRDDLFGKVAAADEIRDNINRFRFDLP